MSMYPREIGNIPAETMRIAWAACPKGTVAMRLRDGLGEVYQDEHFADLYSVKGQPAYAPWRLAVVTILQYLENLTDRQAANAVRERLDWKYALGLRLEDTGFDVSLLSEFRTRLVEKGAEERLLSRLLEVCQQRGLLSKGGKQRTDSTHVLARVRSLSNLECVGETLRAVLDDLAELAPEWLVQQVEEDWFLRYSHRVENDRLPKGEQARVKMAEQIGADGMHLLTALAQSDTPQGLGGLESVQMLRRIWQQYYECQGNRAKWRAGPQPQAEGEPVIRSPYDAEAEVGAKRGKHHFGYKVHFTETCALPEEEGRPHLIVQVTTTPGSVQDVEVTEAIQAELAAADLLPEQLLADTGYASGDLLVSSERRGVALHAPVLADTSWQGLAGKGFALANFQIDWDQHVATCPQGQQSERWQKTGQGEILIRFAPAVCAACPVRAACTRAKTVGRQIQVQAQPIYEALQARREAQSRPAFQKEYAARAGIEGTISQAVRTTGVRRARYEGLAKTHLQHVVTAVAINVLRLDAVLTSTPRGSTRHSHFARLASRRALPTQTSA